MPRYDTISFLSDYGLRDEFVGVVKSVMRSIAPHAAVVDVTHEIPAYDVRAGSLALMRAAHYLCPGVVLAVVDPGVGTTRRAIAVEVGDGESVLVGPDNGLLGPAVALVGGASRAVELSNEAFRLAVPSGTFAGRDVFGPAAAHLSAGIDLLALGPAIDPAELKPGLVRFSAEHGETLEADVLWVDGYGNVQLNVAPEQVARFGDSMKVSVGTRHLLARRTTSFADLDAGQLGFLVDSSGLVALALDRESAADRFGLSEETSVVLAASDSRPPEDR